MSDIVFTYRYLRPIQFSLDRLEFEPQARGGITFLFEFNKTTKQLKYMLTICPDSENFSLEIGKKVVDGRYREDPNAMIQVENYDESFSFINNVCLDLENFTNRVTAEMSRNFGEIEGMKNKDVEMRFKLLSKIRKIIDRNQRTKAKAHDLIDRISEKTRTIYAG